MELTRASLDATPDERIEFEIIDVLTPRITQSHSSADEDYERFIKLSPGLRMMWSTFEVEGEVNNGGFHQFFWNRSGQYASDAIQAFRLIGAEEHAQLVEEAVQLFFAQADKLRPFRERRTFEAFQESEERIDSRVLDDRFYALPDISLQRIRYIREHPQEFVLSDGSGAPE
jgi:hypothetical protein